MSDSIESLIEERWCGHRSLGTPDKGGHVARSLFTRKLRAVCACRDSEAELGPEPELVGVSGEVVCAIERSLGAKGPVVVVLVGCDGIKFVAVVDAVFVGVEGVEEGSQLQTWSRLGQGHGELQVQIGQTIQLEWQGTCQPNR